MHLPLILALITPTSVLTANPTTTTTTLHASTTTKSTLSTTTTTKAHNSETTTKLTMQTSTSASQSVTTTTQADTNNDVAGGTFTTTNPIGEYIINRVKNGQMYISKTLLVLENQTQNTPRHQEKVHQTYQNAQIHYSIKRNNFSFLVYSCISSNCNQLSRKLRILFRSQAKNSNDKHRQINKKYLIHQTILHI